MQQNDSESAGQIAALQNFVTDNRDLAELGRLNAQPDELDIFGTLGTCRLELFHSDFLAWLMDPNQSHGTGEYFLKHFLLATDAQAEKHGTPTIGAAQIDAADLLATRIHREWYAVANDAPGYLDILIVNQEAQFLCGIENKTGWSQATGQLGHYRKALENDYPDFTRQYVLLTSHGTLPYEEERPFCTPVSYITIQQLVERTVADNAASINQDVAAFLRQYATTLRRNIVQAPTEVQQHARKIYLENRAALDLIYLHRPDYVGETQQMLRDAILQQGSWELDQSTKGYLRFRPTAWTKFEPFETGNGFAYTKALLLFEFHITIGSANLMLTLMPGNDERIRERIIASANQNPDVFSQDPISHQTSYLTLYLRECSLIDADLDNWDDPSVRAKIEVWVADFAENAFPRMNEVIVNCLREYAAEQQRGS